MPPQPGDDILVTVFADIHYYFTAPTPKPQHHRFEKSSYLYIYQNVSQSTTRIEIANNPGTEDQDSFQGLLDNVHINHSTEFPTLCTVTVDGRTGVPSQGASELDWRLPSTDGHDDWVRLHTLDIYFWTLDDANEFLDTAKDILAAGQLETDRDIPVEQSNQPMSSVVQQLESVAVSDPAYQNGQTPDSRSNQMPNPAPAQAPTQAAPLSLSFPPQPPSGPSTQEQQAPTEHEVSPEQTKEPEKAPLPYNPAAPAAPEFIKHREKTPPPEDGTEGTGLAAAAAADMGVPYAQPHQANNIGMSSFAPPPTSTPGMPYNTVPATGYASPPPSAGLPHAHTFSVGGTGSALQSPVLPTYQQSFLTGQQAPGGGMSFQDPNAHLYRQQSPYQHNQAGYSNHGYNQPQPQLQRSATDYDIHSQVYRPTMEEIQSHAHKSAKKAMKAPGQRPHGLEDKAARMEGGVNRFFKKLEKKLG